MQRQQAKTKRPHLLVRRKKEKKYSNWSKVEETVLCERLKNEILSVPVSSVLSEKNPKKLLLRLIE